MVDKKEGVSWTIDADIVEKVKYDAEQSDRSRSYIANQLLRKVVNPKKENLVNKFLNKTQ